MSRVLIIEDNRAKLTKIQNFLEEIYPDWTVFDAISYISGMRKIYAEKWDIILLDMSLPIYDSNEQDSSGNKKAVAGREIMKRMLNRGICIPTVIITQFDTFGEKGLSIHTLNKEFESELGEIWRGTINYDDSTNQWEEELRKLLEKIDRGKTDGESANC